MGEQEGAGRAGDGEGGREGGDGEGAGGRVNTLNGDLENMKQALFSGTVAPSEVGRLAK